MRKNVTIVEVTDFIEAVHKRANVEWNEACDLCRELNKDTYGDRYSSNWTYKDIEKYFSDKKALLACEEYLIENNIEVFDLLNA